MCIGILLLKLLLLLLLALLLLQGIVDGSASKPALAQDTNYVVEKKYHIAPYLVAFGAYLKGVSMYQNDRWNVAVNSYYHTFGQKTVSFGQK